MSKPFDAALKGMLEESPADWAALAGFPRQKVSVVDADISSVSAAADKVLLVRGKENWLLHFEFQSGPDRTLPRRMHCYNALLEDRHELPVRSVAVLLAPRADSSSLTGIYERHFDGEQPYLAFRYQIIRVWQMPVEQLLSGGLGTLPLAPISNVAEPELASVIDRMRAQTKHWARPTARDVWTATYLLMGLRYQPILVKGVLQGVLEMEESTTYQEILAKGAQAGALAEAKKTLLLLGRERFGRASARVKQIVEAINDLDRLEDLELQVLKAANWDALLERPNPRSKGRKSPS